MQGLEFAHLISERMALFFVQKWANEQFAQKMTIRSFLVSKMSDSLTSLIWLVLNEPITHIAHQ